MLGIELPKGTGMDLTGVPEGVSHALRQGGGIVAPMTSSLR